MKAKALMKKNSKTSILTTLIFLAGMWTTLAHTGAQHTVSNTTGVVGAVLEGLTHPFTGLDHWMAFVAVGAFACCAGRRENFSWKLALLPAFAFLSGMGIGIFEGSLGLLNGASAFVEYGISFTLVALGAALILAPNISQAKSANSCGDCRVVLYSAALFVVGLPHGWAHGLEFSGGSATAAAFGSGALTAAFTLCILGILAGLALAQVESRLRRPLRPKALRFAGGWLALQGIVLAWLV